MSEKETSFVESKWGTELVFGGPPAARRVASRTFFVLVGLSVLLVLLDAVINTWDVTGYGQFRRMFNIAREDSLPTWYSIILAFTVSALSFLIYLQSRALESPRSVQIGWGLLSVFYLFLSIDDGAEVHERLGSVFKAYSKRPENTEGFAAWLLEVFPSYPWQVFVGPFFVLAGFLMVFFLWRQLPEQRLRVFITLGILCFVLALSLDFIEGLGEDYLNLDKLFSVEASTARHFSKSFEEFLEMLGICFFLRAFLERLISRPAKLSY